MKHSFLIIAYGVLIFSCSKKDAPDDSVTEPTQINLLLGGSSKDRFTDIEVVADGYVAVGSTTSADAQVTGFKGGEDVWLVKMDRNGKIQWQKTFGGTDIDYANAIVLAPDGGFFISGTTKSTNGDIAVNRGMSDAWVIKTDASGGLMWQKTFGGSKDDEATDVINVSTGGFLISLASESTDGDLSTLPPGYIYKSSMFIKLDHLGKVIWKSLSWRYSDERTNALAESSDGGFLGVGYLLNAVLGEKKLHVTKLLANGDYSGSSQYGRDGSHIGYDISRTPNGEYLLAGEFIPKDPVVSNYRNGFLFKIREDQDLDWERYFSKGSDCRFFSVLSSGTSFVMGGATGGNGDVYKDWNGWILESDGFGRETSVRTFGGTNGDAVRAIKPVGGNRFVAVGESNSNDGGLTGQKGIGDAWIFTFDK